MSLHSRGHVGSMTSKFGVLPRVVLVCEGLIVVLPALSNQTMERDPSRFTHAPESRYDVCEEKKAGAVVLEM